MVHTALVVMPLWQVTRSPRSAPQHQRSGPWQAPGDHGKVAATGLAGQEARKALLCGGLPTAEGLGGHLASAVVPPLLASPAQGRARHSSVAVRLPLLVSPSEGSSGHCHVCCGAPAATRAVASPLFLPLTGRSVLPAVTVKVLPALLEEDPSIRVAHTMVPLLPASPAKWPSRHPVIVMTPLVKLVAAS